MGKVYVAHVKNNFGISYFIELAESIFPIIINMFLLS